MEYIHSCFQWYKHYKNTLRNVRVIVENKLAPFSGHCVYIYFLLNDCLVGTDARKNHPLVLLNAVSKLTSFPFPASHVPHLATPAALSYYVLVVTLLRPKCRFVYMCMYIIFCCHLHVDEISDAG